MVALRNSAVENSRRGYGRDGPESSLAFEGKNAAFWRRFITLTQAAKAP